MFPKKHNEFFRQLAATQGVEMASSDESTDTEDYTYSSDEEETEEDRKCAEEHIMTGDEEWDEEWTRSECPCKTCTDMNSAVDNWDRMRLNQPQSLEGALVANAIDHMIGEIIGTIDDEHFARGRPTPKL